MTQLQLQNLVEKIAKHDFHKTFKNHAYFAVPKGRVGGYFDTQNHNIYIKSKYLKVFNLKIFIMLLKHELCHYFIYMGGNHHETHGKIFNHLLRKVGGLRYAPPFSNAIAVYICKKCHQTYNLYQIINTKKYKCSRDNGNLKLIFANHKAQVKHQKKINFERTATPKQKALVKMLGIQF